MNLLLLVLCMIIDGSELYEHDGIRDVGLIALEIERLERSPVSINTATLSELQKIPFLSYTDCQRIIYNRQHHGVFQNANDLKRITGFDELLIERILPFITFTQQHAVHEKTTFRVRGTTSFPWEQYGEEIYGRAISHIKPYVLSGICEKDEYETHYLDYWAAGLIVNYGTGTYAFGKYNLDMGTGIMLSPIGSFYSTTDFHLMVRERGIIPYTSVNENSGFFGAAITDSILVKFSLFYSNQKLDGRIDSSGFARSFYTSGNHIDSTSLDRKDRINEEIAGYEVKYAIGAVQCAQRSYWCTYEPAFRCSDSLFQFYGRTFFMSGLHVHYSGDRSHLFAEVARADRDRFGGICGFGGELPFVDVTIAANYFPNGYYSPKGVEAKSGARGGVIVLENRSPVVRVNAQIGIDGDVGDDTVLYNARLTAEKKIKFVRIKLQMRWRYHEQALDLSGSRIFLRTRVSRWLWIDTRLEERYVFAENSIDRGLYGCLELGVRLGRFTVRARYGLFSTESYYSRLYIYEIDLPGVINNRMLYGEGDYGFIYARMKINKSLGVSAKHAVIRKDQTTAQKSGCQIDWKF